MQIEENTLVVNEPISDEMCEEFIALCQQAEIETIHLSTEQVSSSIMQALFCMRDEKKVVFDDPFLERVYKGSPKQSAKIK